MVRLVNSQVFFCKEFRHFRVFHMSSLYRFIAVTNTKTENGKIGCEPALYSGSQGFSKSYQKTNSGWLQNGLNILQVNETWNLYTILSINSRFPGS